MKPRLSFLVLAPLLIAACTETKTGFAPVLGDDGTAVEKERFARRLYLDLTGLPANEAQSEAVLARLAEEGNTAAARDGLAAELTAAPAFASLYLTETENTVFSGQSLELSYTIVCEIIRATDASCLTCADPDACLCACPALTALGDERQAVREVGAMLASGGATTTDVERAFAATAAFKFLGTSPDGIAMQLFQAFLGRPAEKDEQKNARFMVTGSFLPGSPAGLLFHRHGESYDDLLDIVFESEVYRDAVVSRVFQRYLGRRSTPDELRFFSASLDPENPDLRPIVRAVVSSAEYFHQ